MCDGMESVILGAFERGNEPRSSNLLAPPRDAVCIVAIHAGPGTPSAAAWLTDLADTTTRRCQAKCRRGAPAIPATPPSVVFKLRALFHGQKNWPRHSRQIETPSYVCI